MAQTGPQRLTADDKTPLWIGAEGEPHRSAHVFRQEDIDAVNAALAAKRPLLLRGEPGVGKTQLAKAAAIKLGRGWRQCVIDARMEARDLQWSEDLVQRLADAQMAGMAQPGKAPKGVGAVLDYVDPGPLWWAFAWGDALDQVKRRRHWSSGVKMDAPLEINQPDPACDPQNGVVVLIDEIDKADPELPNGLLEALGSREFSVPGRNDAVKATDWPWVVITTNESRALPDAFIRRCLVHEMTLPEDDLEAFLLTRGRLHFPNMAEEDEGVLREIVRQTIRDRNKAVDLRLSPLPGQAEFLDYLRMAIDLKADTAMLERLRPFFLRKHRELRA